ncbi:MAG: hypothetical protein JJU28_06795 [Cyclobacteriaceae bacterium]|nr:hypothetical protein [Cyclobacteriaceae bacterium]
MKTIINTSLCLMLVALSSLYAMEEKSIHITEFETYLEMISDVSWMQEDAVNTENNSEKTRVVIINTQGRVLREETVDMATFSRSSSILCPLICQSDFLFKNANVAYYLFMKN